MFWVHSMVFALNAKDALSMTRDASQALFYFVGTLAVVIGSAIGFQRFVLERPYGPAWKFSTSECRVREAVVRDAAAGVPVRLYFYVVDLVVENMSKSTQAIASVSLKLALPTDDGFGVPTPLPDVAKFDPPRVLAFGEHLGFANVVSTHDLCQIGRQFYRIEYLRRRTYWFGFRSERSVQEGSITVPFQLEDLRFYSNTPITPRGGG